MIVGQKQTLSLINTLIDQHKFPRTLLLIGPKGCGKHLLTQYIATRLNVPMFDISDKISLSTIESIYTCSEIRLYIINTSDLDERKQNILLKFLEEPMENTYIVMTCENPNYLLNTIVNRCYSITCDLYTQDELIEFLDKDGLTEEDIRFILDTCKTPGQLKNVNGKKLKELSKLTSKIIKSMGKANFSNALTLATKINYKDEYDKFDIDIFLSSMAKELVNQFNNSSDIKLYQMYKSTIDTQKCLNRFNLNKQYVIENYISKLWHIAHEV